MTKSTHSSMSKYMIFLYLLPKYNLGVSIKKKEIHWLPLLVPVLNLLVTLMNQQCLLIAMYTWISIKRHEKGGCDKKKVVALTLFALNFFISSLEYSIFVIKPGCMSWGWYTAKVGNGENIYSSNRENKLTLMKRSQHPNCIIKFIHIRSRVIDLLEKFMIDSNFKMITNSLFFNPVIMWDLNVSKMFLQCFVICWEF